MREYPGGFDEALSDAVEERVAEVKEATLLEATQLIQQWPFLQVTAAAAHFFLFPDRKA